MLTQQQTKATKESASEAVKHWFRSNPAELSLAEYFSQQVGYLNDPKYKERLEAKFGYTEETLNEKLGVYNESFWSSHAYWQRQNMIHQKTFAKYAPIFKEAEEVAHKVDIFDIKDGFPCGSVHLYLSASQHDTDLGKALRHKNGNRSLDAYTYQMPIKYPSLGQSISFSERISERVTEFLKTKGIEVQSYSWID